MLVILLEPISAGNTGVGGRVLRIPLEPLSAGGNRCMWPCVADSVGEHGAYIGSSLAL